MVSGTLISSVAGPLGCFLIWRRLSFLGDTIAHSSLLGIAAGLILGIDPYISVVIFIIFMSLLLGVIVKRTALSTDIQLVLISQGTLGIGLLVISLFPHLQSEINGFLFGDILALSTIDLIYIGIMTVVVLGVFGMFWRQFVCWTLCEDVATIEGQNTRVIRLLFFTLMGIFIAVTAKAIGIILLTALVIIPAATARILSRSPGQMMILASIAGILFFIIGFLLSFTYDLPTTAAIVVTGITIFVILTILGKFNIKLQV